jgi:hypothetical protein
VAAGDTTDVGQTSRSTASLRVSPPPTREPTRSAGHHRPTTQTMTLTSAYPNEMQETRGIRTSTSNQRAGSFRTTIRHRGRGLPTGRDTPALALSQESERQRLSRADDRIGRLQARQLWTSTRLLASEEPKGAPHRAETPSSSRAGAKRGGCEALVMLGRADGLLRVVCGAGGDGRGSVSSRGAWDFDPYEQRTAATLVIGLARVHPPTCGHDQPVE